MSWWIVFWWELVLAGACVALIIAKAIGVHFASKNDLRAADVEFAEKKKDRPDV